MGSGFFGSEFRVQFNCKCSTIGPSARAGMNVRAPTMITVPTSSTTNSGVCVGSVPGPAA